MFESEAARAGLTVSGGEINHRAHRETAKGGIEFWPALVPEEDEETDYYAPGGHGAEGEPGRAAGQRWWPTRSQAG